MCTWNWVMVKSMSKWIEIGTQNLIDLDSVFLIARQDHSVTLYIKNNYLEEDARIVFPLNDENWDKLKRIIKEDSSITPTTGKLPSAPEDFFDPNSIMEG